MGTRWLAVLLVVAALAAGCQGPAPAQPASSAAPAAAPVPAAAASAAPAALASPEPPLEVRVAHAGLTPNVAAVWVAADLGFDRDYGVRIDVHRTRTAALSQAALLAGEIDYAWTGLAPMLGARAGGSDVVFVGATTNRSSAELVVRPPLRRPEELVGKTFGIQSFGGPPHIRTLQTLARLGVDPSSVTILIVGDEAVTTAALLEGAIDGASISYTAAAEPKARGYQSWDLMALGIPEITGIVGLAPYVREHPEPTRRLLRALARANTYIKTINTSDEARQRVGEVVAAHLQQPVEAALLSLDQVRETLPADLRVNADEARELQAFVGSVTPGVQDLRLEDWLDQSALDDLEREGFFARLGLR